MNRATRDITIVIGFLLIVLICSPISLITGIILGLFFAVGILDIFRDG